MELFKKRTLEGIQSYFSQQSHYLIVAPRITFLYFLIKISYIAQNIFHGKLYKLSRTI